MDTLTRKYKSSSSNTHIRQLQITTKLNFFLFGTQNESNEITFCEHKRERYRSVCVDWIICGSRSGRSNTRILEYNRILLLFKQLCIHFDTGRLSIRPMSMKLYEMLCICIWNQIVLIQTMHIKTKPNRKSYRYCRFNAKTHAFPAIASFQCNSPCI